MRLIFSRFSLESKSETSRIIVIWCIAEVSFSRVQNGHIEFAKRCIGSKEEIRAILYGSIVLHRCMVERRREKVTQYFATSLTLHHAQRRSSPPQLQNLYAAHDWE